MFRLVHINSSRNSFSKRIGILNKFTQNAFVNNSTSLKFYYSTVNSLNNTYFQHNLSSSLKEIYLNESYLFSEFGAKKKLSDNHNELEETSEDKAEKVTEKKKEKISIPKNKSKTEKTKNSIEKIKQGTGNKKMEKSDKISTNNKKTFKKTKASLTSEENKENKEGDLNCDF